MRLLTDFRNVGVSCSFHRRVLAAGQVCLAGDLAIKAPGVLFSLSLSLSFLHRKVQLKNSTVVLVVLDDKMVVYVIPTKSRWS